jgi:hypothetical protein
MNNIKPNRADGFTMISQLEFFVQKHGEIIKLTGNSYRMDNRKTIFENTNKTPNLTT